MQNNLEQSMKFSKVRDVKSPLRSTPYSAGIDFFVPNDFNTGDEKLIKPNESIRILSGVKVNVPRGFALIAFNKSGIALKGFDVGACVIDEDYQGEISLHVFNVSSQNLTIVPGQKLVQFILIPVFYAEVEEVAEEVLHPEVSARGAGGFGSTGLQ